MGSIGRSAAWALLLVFSMVTAACSGADPTLVSKGEEATAGDAQATTEPHDDGTEMSESDGAADSLEGATDTADASDELPAAADRAWYILPPGNYGGIPTNDDSLDQLALYDGLTPLRDDISDADLDTYFLRQDFQPIGETRVEETPNDGVEIIYDEFGIPHITGETRDDVAYGAGWVTVRDRELLLRFGRDPARAAVADIPGIDAFSLVTSATPFTPSEAAEALVTEQVELLRAMPEGEELIADAEAYAAGMNAYVEANGLDFPTATVNDVIATTAFIGSIFGAGGGSEARNAEFLSQLENRLGAERGRAVWEDLLRTDDPEAPTTIEERFDYGTLTGGDVTGSVTIDEGSIISLDPRDPAPGSAPGLVAALGAQPPDDGDQGSDGGGEVALGPTAVSRAAVSVDAAVSLDAVSVDAVDNPPDRTASNWLTVAPGASSTGNSLAVMGPQLGYYYPEIVMQMHLKGPDYEAQGAAVPGLAHYLLIGRTNDYAWSLTSAGNDVRDVFAEELCEPDGSEPTRDSGHYVHDGECIAFEIFDAGRLGDIQLVYPVSVHGPVIGTALSDGQPIALSRARSTFGRDGLNLAALKDMTEGDAATAEDFFEVANQFGFTFNWGYANREGIGYFASGLLPRRAEGLDRRLPTLGTGEYEWQGFLGLDEHPHATDHPDGRLLNWNNQAAPGFMHSDGNLYGSHHRVEGFDQWPDAAELTDVVGVMNRSATEDTRSPVWAVVLDVLATADAPTADAAVAADLIAAWVDDDAPLLDADEDLEWDEPAAFLADELWGPVSRAALAPVLQPLFDDEIAIRGLDDESVVDKDLRTLLGQDVEAPYNVSYCGDGDLGRCAADLWTAIDGRISEIRADRGGAPDEWRREGLRSTFTPDLIPDDFRSTNRPTYQQVIEFAREG